MSTLFPSIIPNNDTDRDAPTGPYTAEELADMEWDRLRRLAAAADTDEIDGKTDRETIESYLTGHNRL